MARGLDPPRALLPGEASWRRRSQADAAWLRLGQGRLTGAGGLWLADPIERTSTVGAEAGAEQGDWLDLGPGFSPLGEPLGRPRPAGPGGQGGLPAAPGSNGLSPLASGGPPSRALPPLASGASGLAGRAKGSRQSIHHLNRCLGQLPAESGQSGAQAPSARANPALRGPLPLAVAPVAQPAPGSRDRTGPGLDIARADAVMAAAGMADTVMAETARGDAPMADHANRQAATVCQAQRISLEAEIPEALFDGMRAFIQARPDWDQYRLVTSALAGFLFQHGWADGCVSQHYLNGLFHDDVA